MTKEEMICKAHDMYAYEISEQADQKTQDFDDLWQSLYDIYQLSVHGILEDLEADEISEVKTWLCETQALTKIYHDLDI